MTELIEGEHGICYRCGSPLTGIIFSIGDYTGYYCPECDHWTPKPPGHWTPVNPTWPPDSVEAETVRDRLERSLQREGPYPA